jgi:hypothetical protein
MNKSVTSPPRWGRVIVALAVVLVAIVGGTLLPITSASAAENSGDSERRVVDTGYAQCTLDIRTSSTGAGPGVTIVHEGTLQCSYLAQGVSMRMHFDRFGVDSRSAAVSSPGDVVTHSTSDAKAVNLEPVFGPTSTVPTGLTFLTPEVAPGTPLGWDPWAEVSNGSKITTGGAAKHWLVTESGQLAASANTAYCLDIERGKAQSGAPIHLWKCDGGASEKWRFLHNGVIVSEQDPNYCLTAHSPDPSAILTTEKCDGSAGQRFTRGWGPGARTNQFAEK